MSVQTRLATSGMALVSMEVSLATGYSKQVHIIASWAFAFVF